MRTKERLFRFFLRWRWFYNNVLTMRQRGAVLRYLFATNTTTGTIGRDWVDK